MQKTTYLVATQGKPPPLPSKVRGPVSDFTWESLPWFSSYLIAQPCVPISTEVLGLDYSLESTSNLTALNNVCRLMSSKFILLVSISYLHSGHFKTKLMLSTSKLFLSWVTIMVSLIPPLDPTSVYSQTNRVILPKYKSN